MKKFSFVHLLGMLVLIISLASCGFTQPIYDEDGYAERSGSRVIYNDAYYGNGRIVRDPYTGQYYEVTPVGPYGRYGYPADVYGYPYGTYSNRNRIYNNRVYNNRVPSRNQTNYPRQAQQPRPQQTQPVQQQPQRPAPSQKITETRDIINGKAK